MADPVSNLLSRYGFKIDPFAPSNGKPFYFAPPPIEQRLDLIQHLVEYSDLLLLIIGEQGSGKTAMINQLISSAPELWRVYPLEASVMLDARALLKRIASACGVHCDEQRQESFEGYFESLQAYLDGCKRSNLIPVLLVDDAHTLPLDALGLLFMLVKPEGQRARFRIVLFCEPQIISLLNSPQCRSLKQSLMHVLDIPRFTAEQTRDYLQQSLIHAGLSETLPFTEATLRWVHEASQGLPGRINELARQALLGKQRALGSPKVPAQTRLYHKWQFFTAALLLGLLTVVVVINSMIQGGAQPEPSTQAASPLPLPEPTKAPATSTALNEVTRPPTSRTVAEPPNGEPKDRLQATAPARVPSESESSAPFKAKPPPPLSQSAVENSGQSEVLIPGLKGEEWFQAQSPTDYVLQLFGAHHKAAISRFVLQYKLQDKVAWFGTTLKGKDWYVVVYGPFPDRDQAITGISSLPVELQKLKPWPRSIAEIKQAIRDRH